jgi:hypothetical protein
MRTGFSSLDRWIRPVLLLAGLLIGVAGWAAGLLGPLEPLALPLPPGERAIARMQMQPDGNVYGLAPAADGQWRLLRITPDKVTPVTIVPGLVMPPAEILLTPDLAWQWDVAREQGYVMASTGRLLIYRADGTTTDLGQVAGTRPFEEKSSDGYQLSRTLVITQAGDVYTAGDKGAIHHYTPGAAAVTKLNARLPAIAGRESWASLDAAVIGPDGLLYGGTFDGYMFTFDPKTETVINHGKPLRAQRIAVLVFREGILYGVGGGEQDIPRTFSFDPVTHGFTLGGLFTHGVKGQGQNYYEPVGACAADAAGNIYVSTAGRLGNLYRWAPGQSADAEK